MRKLIVYSSLTGNTKKVAQAIHEEIGGDILPISEVEKWEDYDYILIGFYVDKGFASDEAKDFMEKISNKKLGIFATLGAEPTSEHAIEVMVKVKELLEKNNNEVLKEFICQGAIDPKIIENMLEMAKRMGDKAPHQITPDRIKRWNDAKSHPDSNDLQNAKKAFHGLGVSY